MNLRKNGAQQSLNRNHSKCWHFGFPLNFFEPCSYGFRPFSNGTKKERLCSAWWNVSIRIRSNRTCIEDRWTLGKQIDLKTQILPDWSELFLFSQQKTAHEGAVTWCRTIPITRPKSPLLSCDVQMVHQVPQRCLLSTDSLPVAVKESQPYWVVSSEPLSAGSN